LITVAMFQVHNRETINSTWKVAVLQDHYDESVSWPCFTTQHQTCKTKTKTKTDFLVSDRSRPKTDGLRPYHWSLSTTAINDRHASQFAQK